MVTVTIDGKSIQVEEHTTILDAAAKVGVDIPTLCYLRELNEIGSCRVCVVEVEGIDQLVAACNNYVLDGMVVHTNTPKVREARKVNTEFILSEHDSQCTSCVRSGNCSLQSLANDLNIYELPYDKKLVGGEWTRDFPIIRDADKCIKCMRCIQVCDKVQGCYIWDISSRASRTNIGVAGGIPIEESKCVACGQCITHCPTGALRERDDTDKVFAALADPETTVVVQIAPSVRTSFGETFGLRHDGDKDPVNVLVAGLRRLGFDYVLNTDFTADLTIMEEGSEFIERIKNAENETFPMFTSCCPGWVRFVKANYPQFAGQLSSAKSPQAMFGAVVKSYYAEMLGLDPHKIFSVSIMPCTAKKCECAIPTLNDACGDPDVDVALTVREIDRMLKADHINVPALEPEEFDQPLGYGTGAGIIFGATGGVMEAALRSAYFLVTGENPDPDAFRDVRGLDGWKEARFDIDGIGLKVAVASGLANTRRLLDALDAGEVSYDFVEIMACPGGCVGGGGQPIHDGLELAGCRGDELWGLDKVANLRFSHENPSVARAYEEYFGSPLSERSHHLLHTDNSLWKMPTEV